ncbi:MAG: cobalt ECF transporter T component CbiQ [Thermodesulfovibrionales bacterium]|nr:cobalt ECF transporter T component CbiQ [Thermodesulfovibrionales bacterium]
MHLEEFAEGDSFFHKLDPRIKFLTITPSVCIIAIMKSIETSLIALLLCFVSVAFAKISFKKLFLRLLSVNLFILLLWIFLPFSFTGEAIFDVGPYSATKEGIYKASLITLKSNAIVIITITFLGTSQIFSLAHALIDLKVPKKLVLLFFFFYRYIAVIHDEYIRMKKALLIRNFKPSSNLHTYKTLAYSIGMLIIKSFDRSQRIYNAMLCRGFKNNFPIMSHFQIRSSDITFGIIILLIVSLLIVFDYG